MHSGCIVTVIADHVVPDVKPRDVTTTPAAATAAAGSGVTSQAEDVLDVIDRLSQTTSDEEGHHFSLFDIDDEIFPI